VAGYGLHNHVDFSQKAHHLKNHIATALVKAIGHRVIAAKQEHAAAPSNYFPADAIWTQDISHAPVDPQSAAMISWLGAREDGEATTGCKLISAFRVLQADATTPYVRFKGPGPSAVDSDQTLYLSLPAGGGVEGEADYQCPNGDCHLIVVDRGHGKLTKLTRLTTQRIF